MFHVILHQPQIPPNTGNIIRLCANTGCTLHLIEPLGFELAAPAVRRAGLDYAELAVLRRHPSLDDCLTALAAARCFAVETGTGRRYSELRYRPGDAFLFGAETRGLPHELLQRQPSERRISIPMRSGNRSLNLANAVAVVVYEAWRQSGFALQPLAAQAVGG
ncbi:MAG TPA: tRNA (cytidine(34)-2'-O)-methyltransferase [Steroidobacteraceae bacterium]|jgi:tRNA (cytidine/uridine-2'-O-)-methyltransferase